MSEANTTTGTGNRLLWLAVIVLALALGGVLLRQFGVIGGHPDRQAMNAMVHDYIMQNPEIISDAIDELQKRQAAADKETARQQIAKQSDAIFHDPASVATNDSTDAVNVAEFFDYNCTYCRQSFAATKKLQAKDNVRFVFKEFPILGPGSVFAAKAAIASIQQGRDKYLEFHDAMMTHPGRIEEDSVMKIARKVGLDTDKLLKDMKAPEVQKTIDRNMDLARSIGVTGTPAFVVKDELIPGAVDFPYLDSLVKKKTDS